MLNKRNNGETMYNGSRAGSKVFFAILLVVLAAVVGTMSFKTVPSGHTGVVTSFGKVEEQTLEAGMHLVAPWKTVIKIDNRIQKETMSLKCFSSDLQEVDVVYTINFQIDKSNAQNIYRNIGTKYAEKIIEPRVNESVKSVFAKYTAENIIANRPQLSEQIKESLVRALTVYNINLVDASIDNVDFSDAYTDAVEAKQVAEQNKLRAQTEQEQRNIEAEAAAKRQIIAAQAEADAKLIAANAEAEANRLLQESISSQILTKMYIEKWNGVLPKVTSGEGGMNMVISMDSLTDTPVLQEEQ